MKGRGVSAHHLTAETRSRPEGRTLTVSGPGREGLLAHSVAARRKVEAEQTIGQVERTKDRHRVWPNEARPKVSKAFSLR